MKRTILRNEKGITLLEVVISILLIGVLLISFYGLFIQSKKTNRSSEITSNGTYYAQIEMEKISANPSKLDNYKEKNNKELVSCIEVSSGSTLLYNHVYQYEKVLQDNYKSILTIKDLCNDDNTSVISKLFTIEIIDKSGKTRAIVESVYNIRLIKE